MSPRKLSLFVVLIGLVIFKTQSCFASNREYVVNDQISLSEISIQLYGRPELWKEIAQYNHLMRPYRIHIGQILKLKHKAAVSKAQGNAMLLAFWRNRFGLSTQLAIVTPIDSAVKVSETVKKSQLPSAVILGESNFKQGLVLYQQQNYAKARPFFEMARKSNPDSYAAWFYEINCFKAEQHFSAASKLARQLVLAHPELATMPALSEASLHRFSEDGSE